MKNKLVSFIISLALILSATALLPIFPAFAATVDDANTYSAEVLEAVCPDVITGGDGFYTRGEFIASVIELLNMPQTDGGGIFSDVDAKHPYASHIAHGVRLGFINSQNNFYPDAPITYAQALKIVTIAVGYGERAELTGGYPAGYLKAAKDAKIGSGMDFSSNDPLSYTDGASILFDMAMADILEISSYGDTYEYSTREGKNIFAVNHGIYVSEGVADANEYTGILSKEQSCGKGCISVNGTEFSGEGFHKLIGHKVRVFHKDDSKRTIVYAHPFETNVLEYNQDYNFEISGTNLTVIPPEDDSETYRLAPDYSVIYNGKNLPGANYNSYINPKAGSVKFIDNGDDRVYDLIIIEDVSYSYVERINSLEEKIYDKYRPQGMFDLSDPDAGVYIKDAKGNAISIDAIEPESVLACVVSRDGLYMEFTLCENVAGGRVEEKTADGKLKIKDKFYTLSDYYSENVKEFDKVKLGSEVICYLGYGDDIVYIEEVTRNMEYGFLVDAGTGKGLDAELSVKIMRSSGMEIYLAAEKMNINGKMYSGDDIKANIDAIIASDTQFRTIKFALNKEGRLSKVYSASQSGDLSDVYKEYTDESAPSLYADKVGCYYRVGLLSPYFRPSSSTQMISIAPYVAQNGESASQIAANTALHMKNDETYGTMSTSQLEIDGLYTVTAYDVDESGLPKFLIFHQDTSAQQTNESSAWAVVEKITNTLNADGENVRSIKAFSRGEYLYYYVTDETGDNVKAVIDTVKPGDILRVAYKSGNEITGVVRDFDAINRTVCDPSIGLALPYGSILEYINGYAYSLSNGFTMVVPASTDFSQSIDPSQAVIVNLSRATTVFVKLNKDRNGNVIDAEVSKEPDFSGVETWYNAGTNADFIVSRQRFRDPYLNVIYTD